MVSRPDKQKVNEFLRILLLRCFFFVLAVAAAATSPEATAAVCTVRAMTGVRLHAWCKKHLLKRYCHGPACQRYVGMPGQPQSVRLDLLAAALLPEQWLCSPHAACKIGLPLELRLCFGPCVQFAGQFLGCKIRLEEKQTPWPTVDAQACHGVYTSHVALPAQRAINRRQLLNCQSSHRKIS